MNKEKVLNIIEELENDIQTMREEGEHDLRSVLYKISKAKAKINELEDK